MDYAYARVSAKDQNLERQISDFLCYGIKQSRIYCDKKSGKDFERTSYVKLLAKLKKGDLVVVKSIDRLGRNYDAIIKEWSRITNKIEADILVLDMPLLDTRTKQNSLIGKFISDIVLQVLSFAAENERTNIKARQAEGIAVAKARGVKFGRPKTRYTQNFLSVAKRYKSGELNQKSAAALLGMSRQNFAYHAKRIP